MAYITTQITETRKFMQQKRLDDTEARRQEQLEGINKTLVDQVSAQGEHHQPNKYKTS